MAALALLIIYLSRRGIHAAGNQRRCAHGPPFWFDLASELCRFFAGFVLGLASNIYVLAVKPRGLFPYYALLLCSLLANIVVPMSTFLALPGWGKVAISCAVVFVPIFFASVIFGTVFRDSSQPDIDSGSNIAGAILGGFCESLSLILGFNHLLVVAVVFYGLSAVLGRSARVLRTVGA